MLFRRRRDKDLKMVRHKPRCSFCGKLHGERGVKLVAGSGVFICSECVALAHDILRGPRPPTPA